VHVDLALISLKIALKANFSTYQTFKDSLHIFEFSPAYDQETYGVPSYDSLPPRPANAIK
jgi:hypothetical protein